MTYGSCGCGSGRGIDVGRVRSFLTREEKVSMLKEYKKRPGKRSSGSNRKNKSARK